MMGGPSEESTDGEGDVWEAADTFRPTTLLSEGDRNDRKEQEDYCPAEGNPETEGEYDGFGNKHADSLHG